MPFKDVLVHLESYPDASSDAVIDQAAAFCARLSRQACVVSDHVSIPLKTNWLAELALDLERMARGEEQRSLDNATHVLDRFVHQADLAGVEATSMVLRATPVEMAERLVRLARSYDVCLLPLAGEGTRPTERVEAMVFESGRPVIVLPPACKGRALDQIVIAWDSSAAAARAVADAEPLLVNAATIRIIAVIDDKASAGAGVTADLVRRLCAHGQGDAIAAVDEIKAEGRGVGQVLKDYVADHAAGLLVMGAYGRGRWRERVLGGATEAVLRAPPTAVLLSH